MRIPRIAQPVAVMYVVFRYQPSCAAASDAAFAAWSVVALLVVSGV